MLLQSKPHLGFQYLMQAYGVSLDDMQEKWLDQEEFARSIKESGKAADTERRLTAVEKQKIKEAHDKQVAEIEEFAKDKPYFEEVQEEMKRLVLADINAGKKEKPDLNELYEKAIWMNPKVREKLIAEKTEKPSKSGKDVKNAKKAATRVKKTAEKHEEKKEAPKTLLDELSINYDQFVEQ